MGADPWAVVAQFEAALAGYTGAPAVVTVDSCTNALGLCLRWRRRQEPSGYPETWPPEWQWDAIEQKGVPVVSLPRRTYVGVPMQAQHAGFQVTWRDEDWAGMYELAPWGIWDAAKRFTRGMYTLGRRGLEAGALVCVSFHVGKILGLGRGGAILTDDVMAAEWFRRMRHDGRTPGLSTEQDVITEAGFHCALSPPEAARGLWRLAWLPTDNADLPNEHTDISGQPVFQ